MAEKRLSNSTSCTIKGLSVNPPLLLAPMAGLTHTAFRQLVAGFGGCGLFYTEMLSARALPHESPSSSPWLKRNHREKPIMYQLLVTRPEEIAPAIHKVEMSGADGIDLNMGCTAAAIIKRGGGVALMKDTSRAQKIVAAARRATSLPLTAKIRLGYASQAAHLTEFARMLEDTGVDALVVHARFKEDRLKRPARWQHIGNLRATLGIPIIGNGDIDSPAAALRMFRETGCHAVMIGRAVARRPWLLQRIAAELFDFPCDNLQIDHAAVYNRFISLLQASLPPEYQFPLLKQFTFYFARNYSFGHTLWRLVQKAPSLDEARIVANKFFNTEKPLPNVC
ncbi:MAG: tRNA-dihydrouridine synthase family protein [Deltaproteobacteria bacterium]|nr:tRNA-dihydrouridine synthase family protein [Deltaproteobacteria bacterium]